MVAERPHGVFSGSYSWAAARRRQDQRQLHRRRVAANHSVAEAARPRKIAIGTGNQKAINA
ncbi:hypothetical protein I553_2764 [Mycobacterium xenopi 4042]|uniref:Uncharacterized protein n=1 Tax=Mycobacterium xenopi 4042 TaxID=1299334 RepID=X8BM21_MYCXE|nr:hypothetical protein I553_2764 [Mycobacterium xenopi 4042]